jgi:pyrophosphatase PpaX
MMNLQSPLKAIIFDMDGTLVDTLPILLQVLQETFQRYGDRLVTHADIIAMFGPTEEGMIIQNVPEAVADEALEYFHARYRALHPASAQPFPGIVDLLQALRVRGIKTGVVTGKGARTAAVSLKAFGLEPYVDDMVSGSRVRGEKPQSIHRILSDWGIKAAEAAYVGDMTSDIDAARQAGVQAFGAAWSGGALIDPGESGIVFESALALKTYLLEMDEPSVLGD